MRNRLAPFWLTLCLAVLTLPFIQGCVRDNAAASADIRAFRSGDLYITPNEDVPKTIYVAVRAANSPAGLTAESIREILRGEKFEITDSPSKAGYILNLSILDAGPVDSNRLETLVHRGYGAEAKFSGSGATGILADVLLVQRKVPTSSKSGSRRLKNIAKRNALNSAQMRVALYTPHSLDEDESLHNFFSDALAREIHQAITFSVQGKVDKQYG